MNSLKSPQLIIRVFLGFVIGMMFLWFTTRDINLSLFRNNISDLSLQFIMGSIGIVVLSSVVSAYRWKMLFTENPPRLTRLFVVENTGIGINSLAPIRILAEPIQFAYLTVRDGYKQSQVLASLVLVRMVDLTITLITISVGLLLSPPPHELKEVIWTTSLILTIFLIIVSYISLTVNRWQYFKKFPLIVEYGKIWRGLFQEPVRLTKILFVTNIKWLLLGISGWLIAKDLGLSIDFWQLYVIILIITTIASVIPGLPSGLGPFEFASIIFLGLHGIEREASLVFALTAHLVYFLPPIIIGGINVSIAGTPFPIWNRFTRLVYLDRIFNTSKRN
ncbi:MAG: lysylphosphatidylglycerol synthase transmembrane domain-containing protein [Dehalococcoidia bacterium]